MVIVLTFFFFFQAEDGIRDWSVTGVQTCALPIYPFGGYSLCPTVPRTTALSTPASPSRWPRAHNSAPNRSEERRVGKECRARWSGYDEKNKRKLIRHNSMQMQSNG